MLQLTMTILYVITFEFGPGPITWIYNSEILNDVSVSVATVTNWTFTLAVGALTPKLFASSVSNYTFLIFSAFSLIASIFLFFFMKETKGLSENQIARLYRTDT